MSAPCAVRRLLLVVTALGFASVAGANPLPPGPVLGHPADYVIVTPAAFTGEFQTLAHWRTRQGLPAFVKTMESIVAEYPDGRDDAERVRMFLQDAHAQWGTRWVLLGGAPPSVPARTVHSTFYGGLDFVSDLYFGALQGSWDADGDDVFGEGFITSSDPGDSVDLHCDVFVGRAPVRTVAEAHDFVAKTLRLGFEPYAPTPHVALLSAEVLFPHPWIPGQPITLDGADIVEEAAASGMTATPGITIEKLYENWNDPRWPTAQPLTGPALLAALRAGTDFYIGFLFGRTGVITAGDDTLRASDFAGLTDAPRPTQAWLAGIEIEDFAGDSPGLAFARGATGGAATVIAPSTVSFPTVQRPYLDEFVHQAYPPNRKPVGEANALSKVPLIPFTAYDGVNRVMQMETNLIGDPAARLRLGPAAPIAVDAPAAVTSGSPGFDVVVTSNGEPVADARVVAMIEDVDFALGVTDAEGHARLELAPGSVGTAGLIANAPDGGVFETSMTVAPVVLGVGEGAARLALTAPRPNPALASTRFAGAVEGPAALELFDVGGRRVRTFTLESGRFDVRWDLRDAAGRAVAPGLYVARLASAAGVRTQRLLVSR